MPHATAIYQARADPALGQWSQIDVGVKTGRIGGAAQADHVLVATLGYARRSVANAYAQATQVAWLDGMEAALAAISAGSPRRS